VDIPVWIGNSEGYPMKRQKILVLCFLLLLLVCLAPKMPMYVNAESINLLADAGFESGQYVSEGAGGWLQFYAGYLQGAHVHTGSYAQKMEGGLMTGCWHNISGSPVRGSSIMEFSFWACAGGSSYSGSYLNIRVNICYNDSSSTTFYPANASAKGYTWTRFDETSQINDAKYIYQIQITCDTEHSPIIDGFVDDVSLLRPPPTAQGSIINYYFRDDTYKTLGVSAYGLDSDYTNTYLTSNVTYPLYYGFRVWLVSSATVSTELTNGTPNATIYLDGTETYGNYGGTWLCPETTVNLGYQALKVIVYSSANGVAWTALASYITPVLITKQIEESTWAFTLQVAFEGANAVYSWGNSAHRSGVSGIIFTTPLESEIQLWRINSGDYVGFILGAYIDVIGEAFYVLCLIGAAGTLYFRYRNFGVIAFFFAIFGGFGGLVWFFVPPWAAAVTSVLIIVGTSFLVWRVIR
jgi:hypothetical protein